MTSKSASRNRSGPGAVSLPSLHGGSSDSRHTIRPTMSPRLVSFLFTFIVFVCAITPARAQTNKIFQWQFAQALSQSLPSCRSLGIQVKPFFATNNTHGVPPFYMMSFPVNGMGTPHNTLIGTDESNLAWTVDQPVGAQLLLYVMDSTGSSGGVPPQLFTVVAGSSTQCIPAAPTGAPFTVTANVTDTLTTCQAWGLTIQGGTPPYNVTFAALNSPVVTNVTMGPVDDAFTFIDRADPGTQLIAAISDLNGRWASGTPIVKTTGSTNVDCVGLVSKSGTAAEIKQQALQAAATSKARHQSAIIAGVVVTIVVLLLLAGVGVFLFLRRRKALKKTDKITPRQFESGVGGINVAPAYTEHGTHILSINSFISPSSPTEVKSPSQSNFSSPTNTSAVGSLVGYDRQRMMSAIPPQDNASISSVPLSTTTGGALSVRNPHPHRPAVFSNFPTASVRRSAKAIEAGMTSSISEDSEFYDAATTSRSVERSLSAGPTSVMGRQPSPARSASVGANTPAAQEIIYQHQDAGVVRELPPPYMGPPQS
ncbi:hypothetical protein MIND_01295500 [Mycena indigotica]|uniref:Mid2 domain-containing protein n=1 Tax=Mycena indigotica TaxID=2126181 RepID=A0A8H6S085_9AGAR|nr:uncharacterized protein MIND_01295500 [Mycena indigotica]KAF7290554.1 hypothetical protein MIND_01295500 [Mycena indigotica]